MNHTFSVAWSAIALVVNMHFPLHAYQINAFNDKSFKYCLTQQGASIWIGT